MCLHHLALALPLTRPQGGVLRRLGPIAAAAAIFLGGFGTGLASSNIYGDMQSSQLQQPAATQLVRQAPVPLQQASLTLPDQVRRAVAVVAGLLWCCAVCMRVPIQAPPLASVSAPTRTTGCC